MSSNLPYCDLFRLGINTSHPVADELSRSCDRCRHNVLSIIGVLTWISVVVALVLTIFRLRDPKLRRFPNNLISYFRSSGSAVGINSVIGIGTLCGFKQIQLHGESWEGICITQGILFQFFAFALTMLWIAIVVTMYLALVHKVNVDDLKKWEKPLHALIWLASFVVCFVATLKGKFVPVNSICWIAEPKWQFGCLYSVMSLALFIGTYCVIRIVVVLCKAGENATYFRAGLIHDHIYQQIGFIVVFSWIFSTCTIFGIINLYLESQFTNFYHLTTESFVVTSWYSWCCAFSINSSCVGIYISSTYGVNRQYLKTIPPFLSNTQEVDARAKRKNQVGEFGRDSLTPQLHKMNAEPCSEICNDREEGVTAYSVPTNAGDLAVHVQASKLYTTSILLYAREELRYLERDSLESSDALLSSEASDYLHHSS